MKYIDLFAGCGGLSLGLEKAGFKLALAVEKSPMAAETFYHNFVKRLHSDSEWKQYITLPIEDQFEQKLVVNEVSQVLASDYIIDSLKAEGIDLIAGGPPCQGFSLAGRRNPNDIRNQLPWQFLEMVERIRPKAVLIENVLGIKQNFNKHDEKAPIEQINSVLQGLLPGDVTQLVEINAMHYGAPQHRPRVMVLALRSDIASQIDVFSLEGFWKSANDITDSNMAGYKRPTLAPKVTFKEPRTVGDALWDLQSNEYLHTLRNKKYNQSSGDYAKMMREDVKWMNDEVRKANLESKLYNQTLRNHAEHIKERFRLYQLFQKFDIPVKIFNLVAKAEIPEPEKKEIIYEEIKKTTFPASAPDGEVIAKNIDELYAKIIKLATKKHSQRPLKWDAPSPTVLSLPDDFVHPIEARTMTVREMARLQSFPDSFIFRAKETTGSTRRRFEVPQYTQVGNAVPPILAEAVGRNFYILLRDALKKQTKVVPSVKYSEEISEPVFIAG